MLNNGYQLQSHCFLMSVFICLTFCNMTSDCARLNLKSIDWGRQIQNIIKGVSQRQKSSEQEHYVFKMKGVVE